MLHTRNAQGNVQKSGKSSSSETNNQGLIVTSSTSTGNTDISMGRNPHADISTNSTAYSSKYKAKCGNDTQNEISQL
jgi:hypothetical protein